MMALLRSCMTTAGILIMACSVGLADDSTGTPSTTKESWGKIVWKPSSLELHVESLPKDRKISFPRLNNQMKSLHFEGESPEQTKLTFRPEPETWDIGFPKDVDPQGRVVVFETIEPVLWAKQPHRVSQSEDGSITLPAHHAVTHGVLLRYEPQSHKNTIGYWANAKDWAQWQVQIARPMEFQVEVLQGCGKGHGGSTVAIELAGQTCQFTVEDTGHFQNFKPRNVGTLRVESPGDYSLDVRAIEKVKGAVCDIRQIRLIPVP
ncbi:hypothetical protein Poly24_21130 [Rosistilla carotiformis]|uniref:DUF5077 domain-containing protein n=1 Tax=Rosistilla carotiformis TaxID=2528017 RepID=A0A518JS86_9BACT|nr:hypothetical protein [Rosistilla carotiformis]QDV68404.1 hypothetical protein Poly24_21130 [Rosistilla carotiformis]